MCRHIESTTIMTLRARSWIPGSTAIPPIPRASSLASEADVITCSFQQARVYLELVSKEVTVGARFF
jgi:hypothetical protein